MDSNFEFAGENRNYQLVFVEISSRREYLISVLNYPGCTKDNVHMRKGDLVLLPCKSSFRSFDIWNIRENRVVKEWVSLDDPIPGY